MFKYMCVAIGLIATPQIVGADVVKNACLSSPSQQVSLKTCHCIQIAADAILNKSDQKLAASLILNPDKSQKVKASKSANMDRFWERYEEFGKLAEARCP
jgi:hypothetical protein